jgi:hypothetical protein
MKISKVEKLNIRTILGETRFCQENLKNIEKKNLTWRK